MIIRTLSAPMALAAVLSLSPAAFAQTMIGGQQVTDADMVMVTEHCRTLAMGSDVEAAGNLGNPDNAQPVEPAMPGGELGGSAQATTGNEGNVDNDMPEPAAAATADATTDDTSGVTGNPEAETSLSGGVNTALITLADCKAAGL